MEDDVYGYMVDVDGNVYYDEPELYLTQLKMDDTQQLSTIALNNEVVNNSRLIEARLNQKMTERMAQATYQRPASQTQAYGVMNTYGVAGLSQRGVPLRDIDNPNDPPVLRGRGRDNSRRTIRL